MSIDILMPALSPTMTEGKLAKWLKAKGDSVKPGEVIAEIETDKATMEVEAVDEGVLSDILVPAGTDNVKVNAVIARMSGDDDAPIKAAPPAPAPKPVDAPKAEPPKPAAATPNPAPVTAAGNRIIASPLAKRIAALSNIDLTGVVGSGPHGRIVKADVDKLKASPAAAQAAPTSAKPVAAAPVASGSAPVVPTPASGPDAKALADMLGQRYTLKPNSNVRRTIARRLTEAKATVPHFYLTIHIAIDKLLALRAEVNTRAATKISVNDFVIKAAALALRQKPDVNAAWTPDALVQYQAVDVSVAVATPNGLITPVIKDADKKTLTVIATEMKDLATRARDGKLKPEEYQGGGFTVSNLGMYGISDFGAIINPPQSAIMAVGAGEQRPVVKDGAIAIATMMSCTLSVDHRVVDGALGAEFINVFKQLIEDPISLLI